MDIEQLEALALSEDREGARALLIAGTEDHYFYTCLHLQLDGRFAEVEPLLGAWTKNHGRTERVEEIARRQTLYRFDEDPKAASKVLKKALGLKLNHRPQRPDEEPEHPTQLDPKRVGRAAYMKDALARHPGSLRGFSKHANHWLMSEKLSSELRGELLGRLARPDHPKLVKHVLADLERKGSPGFGSRSVHRLLTTEQLIELERKRPQLAQSQAFVEARIGKLWPNPDEDWRHDPRIKRAFVERLWAYVKGLAPVFNSLAAHVLYHLLDLDRKAGRFDKATFMTYLAIPKRSHYVPEAFLQERAHRDHVADLGAYFGTVTLLDSVTHDDELVEDYLAHFFVSETSFEPYTRFVAKHYLRRQFALTKIARGVGEQERWYELHADPVRFQWFKDQVSIRLLPQNAELVGADDPLRVVFDVKNVTTLVVKVFEINALNFFTTHGKEVDTSVDLDGLVAGREDVIELKEAPVRVVRHDLTFDGFDRPGTFVVELIGNGKSSRALIRKGSLRFVERLTVAGHELTLFDDADQHVPDAEVWFGGRVYRADDHGSVVIPYSTHQKKATVLLRRGGVTTLATFTHRTESFELDASFAVEREQLHPGEEATALVRTMLRVNDAAASVKLIEKPTVSVTTVDRSGVRAQKEYADLELADDRELAVRFRVPDDLAMITFALSGHVKKATTGEEAPLRASRQIALNGIDATDSIDALLLSATPAGFVLSVLGKTGEPRRHQAVHVTTTHASFTFDRHTTLKTDAHGRVHLGELPEITVLAARTEAGVAGRWELGRVGASRRRVTHMLEGERAVIPYVGPAIQRSWFARLLDRPLTDSLSLLEQRAGSYQRDFTKKVRLEDGCVVVEGLPAGDYELHNRATLENCIIRVSRGSRQRGWTTAAQRYLSATRTKYLAIADVDVSDKHVAVKVTGATSATRVHVFARRYLEPASIGEAFAVSTESPRTTVQTKPLAHYLSGRDIGDEYRYILERRLADKFPGNMLPRAGLLLNPWAVRKTDTGVEQTRGGGGYGAAAERAMRAHDAYAAEALALEDDGGGFANTRFLTSAPPLLFNLRPVDGVVRIPRERLADMSSITVVVVDAYATWRDVPLDEVRGPHADRTLALALDAEEHFAEKRQVTRLGTVPAGVEDATSEELVIDDIATASVKVVHTLSDAWKLLTTLCTDTSATKPLADFSFVSRWHALSADEKANKYSEYACHELSLFVQRKDRAFFDEVVAPYLANKLHKTFLDHYLLEEDLSHYLEPWRFGRLNVMEQILLMRRVGDPERARSIADRADLLERDLERDAKLFHTALGAGELDSEDALGFRAAKAETVTTRRRSAKKRARAQGAPPPPAAAPAAFGAQILPKGAGLPQDAPAELDMLAEGEGFDDGAIGGMDLARRDEMQHLYRTADTTEELAENNYYHRRNHEQDETLITVNRFWRDFAGHASGPFCSPHIGDACRHFAEIVCALALSDLPFEAEAPATSFDDGRMRLTTTTPALVFHKEIQPVEPSEHERTPLLVSQNYLRKDDRYAYEGGEQVEKFVSKELLTHVVYVCQVVVTNPTSATQRLEMLLQIPRGAIPVSNGFTTRGRRVHLGAYQTEAVEYAFYFPAPGDYPHFPAHVSKNEHLVAAAPPRTLTVVRRPTEQDTTSWPSVSQLADDEAVITYLQQNNLARLDLSKIAWRMSDRSFFEQVTALLAARHVYDDTLWSYALKHRDPKRLSEYLHHQEPFLRRTGMSLTSTLLQTDPVERNWHEHLAYLPLIGARAHRLGDKRKILNSALDAQYRRFLEVASYERELSADWLLVATYYLFLQDRVADALEMLERVKPEDVTVGLQHAYLRCYAAFYREDLDRAAEIAKEHDEHPVPRWRRLFQGVAAQIQEARHALASVVDADDRDQAQDALAGSTPQLELRLDGHTIEIAHANVTSCELSFYPMDIELLFSRNPFVSQDTDRFSIIAPRLTQAIELTSKSPEVVDLPAAFAADNVIVEAAAAGVRRTVASFSHDLAVHVVEAYGQVRVRDSEGAPQSKVYVKAFARDEGGTVRFYKDGYTDVRGYFDYASLSTDDLDRVQRFALLISSETKGAVIREAAPPTR